ncbi:MAG: L,D-transpeptidase [Candidatus Sericytochromatia bacterium]
MMNFSAFSLALSASLIFAGAAEATVPMPMALDPVVNAQQAPLFRNLIAPVAEAPADSAVKPWWPLRALPVSSPEPSATPEPLPEPTPTQAPTPSPVPTPRPTPTPYVPGKVILPKLSAATVLKVSKRQQRLFVTDKGQTLASFPVSTGLRERDTPVGTFRILTKVAHPAYSGSLHLGKRYYPPKHPQNPLGSRWMQFNGWHYYSKAMLGIHGTDEPQNVGKAVSGGCVRMFNADVERLFDALPVGAKLVISKD